MSQSTHNRVQSYYGETLQGSGDLKTTACCTLDAPPDHLRSFLDNVHEKVRARYYGCGLVAPGALNSAYLLDLGCGTGQDVYLLSQLAGPSGHVTGVDMTDAQLQIARDTEEWHRRRFGYATPNTEFRHGYIERLDDLKIEPETIDVIVSNCVVNLAADKLAVFRGAYRLLKPGGEMYFSDVYADRRVPEALRADPVLYGECLSGALYTRDFQETARRAGFVAPIRVSSRPLEITSPELAKKLGNISFVSEVWRLFKHPELEPISEDYGQTATYLGGLVDDAHEAFSETAQFPKGVAMPVDGNMALILQESRYAPYFEVSRKGTHQGGFEASAHPNRASCC